MKKLIAILFLFTFSLFLGKSQSEVTYVDSLKNVTVSVNSDFNKQSNLTNKLQTELNKSVDSQILVNTSLQEGIEELTSIVGTYTKEIEKRNKSDGTLLTELFNYTSGEVLRSIRLERWLFFIAWIFSGLYVLYLVNTKNIFTYGAGKPWPILLVQCFAHTLLVIGVYYFLINILTLLFNSDYYTIKELLTLYT